MLSQKGDQLRHLPVKSLGKATRSEESVKKYLGQPTCKNLYNFYLLFFTTYHVLSGISAIVTNFLKCYYIIN